jgi:hypothetical protein
VASTVTAATNATKGNETDAAAPPTQQEGTQQGALPTQESTEKGGNVLDQI